MTIAFYIKAIPDDLQHGFYDSPLLRVSMPTNWNGSRAEALEQARKLFKEQFNCTDTEFGASYRFE